MTSSERDVVLPSINEMFPEHLFKESHYSGSTKCRCRESTPSKCINASPLLSSSSSPRMKSSSHEGQQFDRVPGGRESHSSTPRASLQSLPPSSSSSPRLPVLGHSGSSTRIIDLREEITAVGRTMPPVDQGVPLLPPSSYSSIHTAPKHPYSASSSFREIRRGSDASDYNPNVASDSDLAGSHSTKKHICPTCFKRFNRPSSLRIHLNTHTGATPFRCPWSGCAREFNVNSNMRRHYRNHTTTGTAIPNNIGMVRSKRGSQQKAASIPSRGPQKTTTTPPSQSHNPNRTPTPALDRADNSMEYESDEDDEEEDKDELESLPDDIDTRAAANTITTTTTTPFGHPWKRRNSYPYSVKHHPYDSRSRPISGRGLHVDVRFNKRMRDPTSPSPVTPGRYRYAPSAPYTRSFADPRVSTALRPAFH